MRRWLDWRWLVLGLYAALVAFTIVHHEPWEDEAHAWMLARENSLTDLVFKYAPYEGSPPLWHILLWGLSHTGMGYGSMQVLAGAFAVAGTALLLWRSPLPVALKILVPFGYWHAYQYAVIARSYVMVAPLLYLLAIFWPTRLERPWRLAAVLALLALTSAHGFAAAGAIAGLIVLDLLCQCRRLQTAALLRATGALAVLLLLAAVIFWLFRKPADVTFEAKNTKVTLRFTKIFARATVDMVWSSSRSMSGLVLLMSIWWFFKRGVLLMWLAPTVTVFLILWIVWWNEWHMGVIYMLWVWALWLSFDPRVGRPWKPMAWRARVALAVFVIAVESQIGWSVQNIWLDRHESYNGAKAAAQYLRDNQIDTHRLCAVGYPCTALLPYLDGQPYLNWNRGQPPAIWWWSERFHVTVEPDELIALKPAAIIRPIKPPLWKTDVKYPGYFKAAVFIGQMYFEGTIKEENSFEIWLPIEQMPAGPLPLRKP